MIAPYGRKKARGWRRRMRVLDLWAAERAALDLDDPVAGYESAEIGFESWPWPFPVRVRRRMVQHLVHVHDRWQSRLSARGEPFYLGIWLFEPAFRGSQVCAAVGPRAEVYADRHDPALHAPPPALYHGHPCDLERFEWTRHLRADRELLSSFDPVDRPLMLRSARAVERTPDGPLLTLMGEDWFGRLPSDLPDPP